MDGRILNDKKNGIVIVKYIQQYDANVSFTRKIQTSNTNWKWEEPESSTG